MSNQLAREHQLIMKTLGEEDDGEEDLNDIMGNSTPSKHLAKSDKKKTINGDEEKSEKEPVK